MPAVEYICTGVFLKFGVRSHPRLFWTQLSLHRSSNSKRERDASSRRVASKTRTPEAPIYGCPRYWGFEGPKSALSLSEFWGFEGKIAQTLSVLGDLRLIWDALDLVHGPKII